MVTVSEDDTDNLAKEYTAEENKHFRVRTPRQLMGITPARKADSEILAQVFEIGRGISALRSEETGFELGAAEEIESYTLPLRRTK